MVLRSLSSGDERFVHALARLEIAAGRGALAPGPETTAGWAASFATPGWTVAKRLWLRADGVCEVLCQVLAPAADQASVRACLESLGHGPWRQPASDEEFERWLTAVGPWQALVRPARYRAGERWLACPFRTADLWPRLAAAAQHSRQAVGYQTNLYACQPGVPVLREVALNHVRLQAQAGVPSRLLELQDRLQARSRRSRWLAEEILMLGTPTLAAAVQRDVDRLFRCAYEDMGDGPQLDFAEGGLQDNLALACDYDQHWAQDPGTLAAQAMDLEAAVANLDLHADLDALPTLPAAQPGHGPASAGAASAPYVFISYAHLDVVDMRRVRNWLEQAGIPTWVDEHLQGGEEWDAVLEDRIRHCAVLLVLMSPAAAQSRFVRRELRFADACGRQLLCFWLREATLVDGMAMLLQPLQWIEAQAEGAAEHLVRAAQRWLQPPASSQRA